MSRRRNRSCRFPLMMALVSGGLGWFSPIQAEESNVALTWDNLTTRAASFEDLGFSGSILVVHDGEVVLHEGYGMADRERGVPNEAETVYAIGSTPIDFTHGAILRLADRGALEIDDPITRFVDDVPADKRTITIEHLLSGRSGLPDFHDIPGEDADPDLSWIDRDTAVRRILSKRLLFEPGLDRQHSHSAWVLLAAIVELVSGRPYAAFLDEEFFVPAGMTHTGLYPRAADFPVETVALGYGAKRIGLRNSPIEWGPTSWLVMGSGGMVSTVGDLYRWAAWIRSEGTLSRSSREEYGDHLAGVGGNDRGFFCASAVDGGDYAFLCSNDHAGRRGIETELGRALTMLVLDESPFEVDAETAGPREEADQAFQDGRWQDAIAAYEGLHAEFPEDAAIAFRLARAYHASGDYERSVEAHRVASTFPEVKAPALFNVACALALLGRTDAALAALREAIDAGFDSVSDIQNDPDLDALRGDPRFAELVLALHPRQGS